MKEGNAFSEQGVSSYSRPLLSGKNVNAMDRWTATKLMDLVGNPPVRIVLWNDQEVLAPKDAPVSMHFHDRSSLYKLITNPDLHFGDLYSAGRITIEGDLVAFLEFVYTSMTRMANENGWAAKLFNAWQKRPRANSLSGSLDNIHHHYDLGNAFYEQWLDNEAMQYTCAYYPSAEATLEQAQLAKLDHVARKLQLKPGDTVIEAGCGWGGLARHFAKHYGVKMRSYNISKEQLAYAREKAKQQGLDGRIDYIEDDYRNATGECDVFVSIGMLEHVGTKHYQELGSVVDRVLKPNGRGLIHSIGRNAPGLMNAWIEKRIFPGAYPPSLKEMMDIFEPNGFSVLDVENIRLHYAQTLRHWLERFDNHEEQIAEHFDENFVRAWRLYLCGSVAAFTTGELQLFQVLFNRGTSNQVPWTRKHIYE